MKGEEQAGRPRLQHTEQLVEAGGAGVGQRGRWRPFPGLKAFIHHVPERRRNASTEQRKKGAASTGRRAGRI